VTGSLRLYSLLWWCLLPFVVLRLLWRSRREPAYLQHLAERFAFYSVRPSAPLIWVHAVSVGETRAAEPLLRALLSEYPDYQVLLTHMTPTGRAAAKALFGNEPRLIQAYLPYDTLTMMARFVQHFQPRLCVLMETEVWPALIQACKAAEVPVALVNARLSERSLKRGQRFAGLLGRAAAQLSLVAAQSDADAQRLRMMGVRDVQVIGNLKFDVTVPATMVAAGKSLRQQIGDRPVLLCASTREGEEALLLSGYMKATLPSDLLLVIVPRHPQRFVEVAQLFADQGLRVVRKSQLLGQAVPADAQLLVGDTMGEMFAYYTACDLAFIGGSLLPTGGQNLIEACACGKPVLLGPHTYNFAEASENAIAQGAAIRVYDAVQIFKTAFDLILDRERLLQMSQAAQRFAESEGGATQRTIDLIGNVLVDGRSPNLPA
jgi:3-deoxy-D-manno-octulosonic-acid transferase